MSTIVTRAGKGSALTWTEGDANITNLNNDKIEDIVEDLTPQLGGDLDVNGKVITSASNGDITITPNGTGAVVIDGNEFPQTQGAVGQILVADGGGLLEWANQEKLTAKVINADSVTINKGEPVYVFSAQGDLIAVKRALNTGDSTSAQTLGLAAGSIAASAEGVVICQGVLTNVDTSTYTAGQGLYLGSTAGSKTTTKPYAPNHLVYLGFVEKVNASSGRIYVRVQNGYELDEIHDVQITTTPSDGQVLAYEAATSLWKPATVSGGGGLANIVEDTTPQLGGNLDVNGQSIVSVSNGNIVITPNGTGSIILEGQSWPQADGTANQVLKTNGSGQLSWTTPAASFDPASPGAIGGTTPAAGTFTALTATGATDTPSIVTPTTAISSTLWTTLGINLQLKNRTYTDTTGTGSISTKVANSMGTPTFASSNAMTITDAANLYLTAAPSAGTNTTITNSWALLANGRIKATAIDATPVGSTTASTGAFTTLTFKNPIEAIYDIGTTGGTIAPNVANGSVQKITLNSALTINAFTSPTAGQSLTLIITGGTAYTSITSTMKFAGGVKTLTGTAGCIDILTVYYDGTNYYASLGKGYA